jgi:hypothetical protein
MMKTGFPDKIVGVAGFEPTASTSQMWRDTGLRYTPNITLKFLTRKLSLNCDANIAAIS